MCKNCYLSKYHRDRRANKRLAAAQQKGESEVKVKGRRGKAVVKITTTQAILMTTG
jgi:hypothetical protein